MVLKDIRIASAQELDAWATELGVAPRRQIVDKDQPGYDDTLTGIRMEPDAMFRARLLDQLRSVGAREEATRALNRNVAIPLARIHAMLLKLERVTLATSDEPQSLAQDVFMELRKWGNIL